MAFDLPKRGLVFWPVGNGDSTTIVVDSSLFLQVDLNNLQKSEEDDDPTWCVIDELIACLPKRNKRPYLAAFALTHPDQDHCCGFETLLEKIDIGELWATPRVFAEYKMDLSDDATAFKMEAERRVKATIDAKGDPGPGNRVRVFGYSSLLNLKELKDLPADRLVIPGNELTTIDEVDVKDRFRVFAHSPFKDDLEGARNDTSLGMQVTLYDGDSTVQALLFGDLGYPALKRIFEVSKIDDVSWNVLLAPHHCSKCAMYGRDEGEDEETLKPDILDAIDSASTSPNRVVSSSNPVPSSNQKGDNPPHAEAKKRYEGITTGFICTMEHPNEDKPHPIVFKLEDGELKIAAVAATAKSAAAAATGARGGDEPPGAAVTYG